MTNYDWRVQVIAYGVRDGWHSKLVDTPHFELRSNVVFGGVWNQDGAAITAARFFERLLITGDTVNVIVIAVDDSGPIKHYTYTVTSDGLVLS